jgi:tRNA dimethylallyltransferase
MKLLPVMTMVLRPQVVCIGGVTAVGKSTVAMAVCSKLGGEIVSADSVQVYRGLQIGANKPSPEDLTAVPHHLVDYVDLEDDGFTTGQWFRDAHRAIEDIHSRGKIPVVIGGTMMYLQWLVQGKPDAPAGPAHIQKQVELELEPFRAGEDWQGALALLKSRHPTRADSINRNDWIRLSRALEVVAVSTEQGRAGPLFTGQRTDRLSDKYDVRCFFLLGDREECARRVDQRCGAMIEEGLLHEVSSLMEQGRLREDSCAGRAIGYRQSIGYLLEQHTSDGEVEKGRFLRFFSDFCCATRNYAKDQIKWFRGDKGKDFFWIYRDFADHNGTSLIAQQIADAACLPPNHFLEALASEEQTELRQRSFKDAKKVRKGLAARIDSCEFYTKYTSSASSQRRFLCSPLSLTHPRCGNISPSLPGLKRIVFSKYYRKQESAATELRMSDNWVLHPPRLLPW